MEYCLDCAGYGYTPRGADNGWLYCSTCNGKQQRPAEDYESSRRTQIETVYENIRSDPQKINKNTTQPASRRRQPIGKVGV